MIVSEVLSGENRSKRLPEQGTRWGREGEWGDCGLSLGRAVWKSGAER